MARRKVYVVSVSQYGCPVLFDTLLAAQDFVVANSDVAGVIHESYVQRTGQPFDTSGRTWAYSMPGYSHSMSFEEVLG